MISIQVNDLQKKFDAELSIQELVAKMQISSSGIAVAVNSSVVKKEDWSSKIVKNNDTVLIITSTQGG
ncbi:sulfur carrier protein ThiS [Tenacibaculum sp. SG-28]|uniref:sulfur carrier protein ThiS n=1 Tax=Tenacibaculum sp. SG-28 TaxID=754426 RepID=UPI000CF3B4D4|nr:sulfur carrier protein ThiS [Tenacibaculum sp. SG-28]PQJ20694.1 thiamine biosynthesis protein ThiS [Tenacibaculum sp. SG-28]